MSSWHPPAWTARHPPVPADRSVCMGSRQQVPRVSTVRLMRCSSHRRGEALAGAPLDNAPKEYPPKIQQLVQDIASLTLLEISDLNELLKVSPAGPGQWGLGACVLLLVYVGGRVR